MITRWMSGATVALTIATALPASTALPTAASTGLPAVGSAALSETLPTAASARGAALGWRPCPGEKSELECADLAVPLDWDEPDGRKITLRLGRLPATGTAEGSVLIAYGGPGGPGIATTQAHAEIWANLRTRMNVVTWDTRGYGEQFGGRSDGLPCVWTRVPYPEFPADDADFGRLSDTNRGYAQACRHGDPEFFAHMSSADHARDMEAIRQALGEEGLNFYGASYAGLYAQAYARLFPARVRTMVLDGTVNHSEADWLKEVGESARDNQAAMRRFFDWCDDEDTCPLGDAARDWRRLLAKAERAPIAARRVEASYGAQDLRSFALGLARAGEEQWPALGRAVQDALRGDASGFAPPRGARYPDLTTPVTECLDWPRFRDRAETAAALTRLRRIAPDTGAAFTLAAGALACVGWPVETTNPPKPLPSGLPPLLGAGAWVESAMTARVVRQVPGSVTIRHEGPGHTLYPFNDCARDHIDRYLTDRRTPPRNTVC
ncbi:alpha/beta fold hydrolase [Streptosporangium jomthongense]|uniref:Alpha/beta fold hydrolase n=1 Tax=Streptosporangium jomthongense TaxID=1193683 RepID=A0ABV8F719_9ACTN